MAISALFLGTTLFAQGSLDRKPKPGNPGQGSGPSRPDNKPSDPPRRPDPKPSNPPPSRPDVKPDQGPRPRPDVKPDQGPRPRPDVKPDQGPRPRPDVKPNDPPPTRPDNDLRPRPRPDTNPPKVNDPPRPRPGDDRPPTRPDNDLRPRPGNGNQGPGNGNQGPGNPPDRRPNPDRNPKIFDPPTNNQGGQLGRVDRPDNRPSPKSPDSGIGRRGGNSYGGQVSNQNREERRGQPIRIDRAPIDIFRGGLQHQVRREDNIRLRGSWRSGYYHYRRDWRDDNFWYSGYIFNPFTTPYCYVSPWYYYPHLPAYVSPHRVTVINISLNPWYGTAYNWRRPANYNWDNWSNYNSLDYALEDITRSFERVDRRALRRLIPEQDRVAIFVDGEYSYSMEPYDFEEFLLDAVEGTETIRYEITRVQRKGREAEIQARHEYEDTWGRRTVVYHQYRLEEQRQGYVIRRFGTSYYGN